MAESINISRLRGPSTLLRYGLAVLAVSAATIIQQFGDEHFAVTPSYFCAVLLTACGPDRQRSSLNPEPFQE
jgi:hypothetical protein